MVCEEQGVSIRPNGIGERLHVVVQGACCAAAFGKEVHRGLDERARDVDDWIRQHNEL